MALLSIAGAVWLVAGVFYWLSRKSGDAPAPAVTTSTADVLTQVSASVTVPARAASASAPPAPPIDLMSCVTEAFKPDTIGNLEGLSFEFVCAQNNPLKGGTSMRARLVTAAGKGRVTDAMREWAGLGWYEMAAYSIIRVRCCQQVEPVSFHFNLACPIDTAINDWEEALVGGNRESVEDAVSDYSKAVRCLSQFGQSTNFGRNGPPGAGVTALRRIIARKFDE